MTSLPGDSDNSGSVRPPGTAQAPYPVCARCGTPADGPRPTWTCSVENGLRHYFCDHCARANIRAIEGRVDSAWW
ncbi:hypothetical protein [Streptomyces sp. TP-A0356]|uniref:hypothetical protein n=1 Tax=Streptomyces sp. TP-A0356 TaxID=1359208 RepID=UPI00131C57ED|nr:hypothetical protein [Streptomyces sp. TP-A0356]